MDKDYSGTNLVVFTQQCHSGLKERFDDLVVAVKKHAVDNKLEEPKKQDVLNKIFGSVLPHFKAEDYFK